MRSDLMKEGSTRAPHRSLLRALGLTDDEMKRPFVAVSVLRAITFRATGI